MSAVLTPTVSPTVDQSFVPFQDLQHLRPDLPVYARQTLPDGTTQVVMTGPAAMEAAKGESNALAIMAGAGVVGTGLGLFFAWLATPSDEPEQPKQKTRRRR